MSDPLGRSGARGKSREPQTLREPRIWFVNRFFWPDHSATSQILSDLAFYLAAKGHSIGVITSRGSYDETEDRLPEFELVRGVQVHRVAQTRFGRAKLIGRTADYASMYCSFAGAVARLAQRGDTVVVKTDPPMLSCAIAPVARARGLHQVNWLQDLYPEVALGLGLDALKPFAPTLVALRDWSLRASAVNVAIGERMADRLVARKIARSKIAVIQNWCDDQSIRPNEQESQLRSAWGLDGKFVVGYSGNLGRAHEFETLLAAAELLRHEPEIVFLFVGGGHYVESLKRESKNRGLERAFEFQPYQPASALAQSLSVPDVHWISLRPEMEGLIVPSKFVGVAAAGRPTIGVCDPHGEVSEIIRSHDCGASVRPGDGEGLAAAILSLRDDKPRCQQLGRNARAMVEQGLTRMRAFNLWEELFAALAGSMESAPRRLEAEEFAASAPVSS